MRMPSATSKSTLGHTDLAQTNPFATHNGGSRCTTQKQYTLSTAESVYWSSHWWRRCRAFRRPTNKSQDMVMAWLSGVALLRAVQPSNQHVTAVRALKQCPGYPQPTTQENRLRLDTSTRESTPDHETLMLGGAPGDAIMRMHRPGTYPSTQPLRRNDMPDPVSLLCAIQSVRPEMLSAG